MTAENKAPLLCDNWEDNDKFIIVGYDYSVQEMKMCWQLLVAFCSQRFAFYGIKSKVKIRKSIHSYH